MDDAGGLAVDALIRARYLVTMLVEPVALTGQRWVSLEPLDREHLPEIDAVAADGELGGLWFTGAPKAGSKAEGPR